MSNTTNPVKASEMSLPEYLRWLATTLGPVTARELLKRAEQAGDLLAACNELVQFFDQCRPGGKVLKSDPDIDAARAAIAKAGSSGSEQAVQNNQAETGAGKPAFRATKVQPDEPGEVYRVVGPYGTVAVCAGEGSQEQADDAALLLSNVWLHMQMPTLLRLASLVLEDSSKLPAFVDAHGAAIKQAVVNGGVA